MKPINKQLDKKLFEYDGIRLVSFLIIQPELLQRPLTHPTLYCPHRIKIVIYRRLYISWHYANSVFRLE